MMTQYLVCDLDDSLLKTDLLYEQWFFLLKNHPIIFFLSFLWILKSKSYFKKKLVQYTILQPETLPYREEIIKAIQKFRYETNGKVILATASPIEWANLISDYLKIFDYCLGSDNNINLKSKEKLKSIKELVGDGHYTYIGDSFADLPLWKESYKIIAINPSFSLKKKICSLNKEIHIIQDRKNIFLKLLKQIRVYQWIKNILIFLPLLAAHRYFDFYTFKHALIAFFSFSFAASFVYVLNDLLDLFSDRLHFSKKNRPFASGDLPIQYGYFLLPVLFLIAFSLTTFISFSFLKWISLYIILNLFYSFYFKQVAILDIIFLSSMYTLRIFAGSSATMIDISPWLLNFSTFFFFGLASIKRYTEIVKNNKKNKIEGRGYLKEDQIFISILGISSSMSSLLIFLFYIQGENAQILYKKSFNLWFLTPIMLFWLSRIWLLAYRKELADDPVIFALKDRISWVCLVLLSIVIGVSL